MMKSPLILPLEIKYQVCEKDLDDKGIQAFVNSLLQEGNGVMCYTPFQYFEFHDTYLGILEDEILIEKPLFYENDSK